ncbi:MAG: ComEA family DNA-binding protein [Oscillospiraceae bacterium]
MQGRTLAGAALCLTLLFIGFTVGLFVGTRSRGDVYTVKAGGGINLFSSNTDIAEASPGTETIAPSNKLALPASQDHETAPEASDASNSGPGGKYEGGLININLADYETLQELPGIGEALALRIIQYREQNGPFEYIDEIMDVEGIGEKKFESIMSLICV